MLSFIKAYIKSMRLYYAFVTGIAGWLGVAYYEYIAMSPGQTIEIIPSIGRKTVILILLFLSWGINQIINDYLGLKEDRINAPHRPMVTGELDPKKALLTSFVILALMSAVIVTYLEPIALIPAIAGILLNIIYEYAKGYSILGNIVFGHMISMCSVLGFLAAGPVSLPVITKNLVSLLIIVCAMNGLMTFYTYFKDYTGDKAAGKKTVVVQLGIERSRIIAIISAFIPAVIFAILTFSNMIDVELNNIFLFLAGLAVFLELWTGYLYYKYPSGEKTYYSLSTNFRACACGQAALTALFDPTLAMVLFIISYIFVGFLFDLHSDREA